MTALLALAASLALPGGQTYTVDDDGPADFTEIADAIAASAPGDVLLVAHGYYQPFALGHELAILGPATGPLPHVGGRSLVEGAPAATLAGLELDALTLHAVPGRVTIDECVLRKWQPALPGIGGTSGLAGVLLIVDCDQVEVSRSRIALGDTCTFYGTNGLAVRAVDSTVAFVACDVQSPPGCDTFFSDDWGDGNGGVWSDHSWLLFADTSVRAGEPGEGCGFLLCSTCCEGLDRPALVLADRSEVTLRGNGDELFAGTSIEAVVLADAESKLVHSGVQFAGAIVGPVPGNILAPAQQPFLVALGEDEPGSVRRVLLHGPPGTAAIVVAALAPDVGKLPGFADKVWIAVPSVVSAFPLAVSAAGGPGAALYTVPPLAGLAGATLHLQAVLPGLQGALPPIGTATTNPANLVLRF